MLDTLTTTANSVSTGNFVLCTIASLILGIIIAFAFNFKQNKTKSFMMTLALLPVIVQVVIMLVNGNIGTGVAVMGAFSLVRFRSVPGSAMDICAIFLSMAVGLATGTAHLGLAVCLALSVSLLNIVYTLLPVANKKRCEKELNITIPESLDYTNVFNDIFEKYLESCELVNVKTTNMGSLFKLKYKVTFKKDVNEKQLIDELRCRNGNLEIMCSRVPDPIEQSF
ncbi:MAG: DUF4956 domain-containing protein [Oscillospiraceae bacterium]